MLCICPVMTYLANSGGYYTFGTKAVSSTGAQDRNGETKED